MKASVGEKSQICSQTSQKYFVLINQFSVKLKVSLVFQTKWVIRLQTEGFLKLKEKKNDANLFPLNCSRGSTWPSVWCRRNVKERNKSLVSVRLAEAKLRSLFSKSYKLFGKSTSCSIWSFGINENQKLQWVFHSCPCFHCLLWRLIKSASRRQLVLNLFSFLSARSLCVHVAVSFMITASSAEWI